MSANLMAAQANAAGQAFSPQTNGFANPARSTTWDSQGPYENEQTYRAANGLQKKASGDLGGISSEKDSVMDYYKVQGTNKKAAPQAVKGKPKAQVQKKPTKGGKADPNWNAVEHDENNWIHRDKLQEIEIREMEELGFRVGRASRSNSRSQSATRKPRGRTNSESTDRTQDAEERLEPRRVVSPIPAEDEEVVEKYHSQSPATTEAPLSDELSTSPRLTHAVKPSTSRIPMPGRSGIPVPASMADREAPLPRSRTGSANMTGDIAAAGARVRVRGGSISSQFLLDDQQESRETTPPSKGHSRNTSSSGSSSSPQKTSTKARTPGKPATTSKTRKTNVQRNGSKNRLASSNSTTKRPGTSGASAPRPNTSNRPEGEAPWLATMYKPDPRLPPDQQIIPTHAKKMQQEQWVSEGRVASMYDKDFQPLNTDDPGEKRMSQLLCIDTEKAQQYEEWPLASPAKQSPLEKIEQTATKTSITEQPGYKLTPSIPQSPRIPSPQPTPVVDPSPPKPTTTRLPEPVEEAKEKKGACCIVM